MSEPSPLLRALSAAHGEVPSDLVRFDSLARGEPWPSFEEYSARLGEAGVVTSLWRQTCYFDVVTDPALIRVANTRFQALAGALGFAIPETFSKALAAGAVAGPDVLQIVLGIDANTERPRLKYYLIFRDDSAVTVERLRRALEVSALPSSLRPGSVYILGVDFTREGLSDFKVYVRLDPKRAPAVIRNLREFRSLWRGSRYVVFQHCQLSGGRQVYFHATAAEVLDRWLAGWARSFVDGPIADMNARLTADGGSPLRPWIASLPYHDGHLLPQPSNIYFHFDGGGEAPSTGPRDR